MPANTSRNKKNHQNTPLSFRICYTFPPFPFLFLIKWLQETQKCWMFSDEPKLFLVVQVAWSRVTDDTEGTYGAADILCSYSSMKTLNWRWIVPVGEKPSTCLYGNLWDQGSLGQSLWCLEEVSRGGGSKNGSGCRGREVSQAKYQLSVGCVSVFEHLTSLCCFQRKKK